MYIKGSQLILYLVRGPWQYQSLEVVCVLLLLIFHFLCLQRTRTEQPSFLEPLTTNPQISRIHPRTNTAGHPPRPRPNWAQGGPPESQPTTSTTRGTWTSSMCLTRACQGKKDMEKGKEGMMAACVGGAD